MSTTNVRVARFTESKSTPVPLTKDQPTVADALKGAGMKPERGEVIMVNGRTADESAPLKEGDVITLANKPAGGVS